MAEYEQRKRVPCRRIDCPHCGNEILAIGVNEDQKCPHCRRKYRIKYTKHGKKFHWEPEVIDYSYEAEGRPFAGNRLEREQYGRNGKR